MGLLTAVVAASRLFGAILFGARGRSAASDVAVLAFAGILAAAIVMALAVVVRREVAPHAA